MHQLCHFYPAYTLRTTPLIHLLFTNVSCYSLMNTHWLSRKIAISNLLCFVFYPLSAHTSLTLLVATTWRIHDDQVKKISSPLYHCWLLPLEECTMTKSKNCHSSFDLFSVIYGNWQFGLFFLHKPTTFWMKVCTWLFNIYCIGFFKIIAFPMSMNSLLVMRFSNQGFPPWQTKV